MPITTTSQLLHDGPRNVVMQFTGFVDVNDSGQESLVRKVDVSDLPTPCSSVKILRLQYEVSGGLVRLFWDATDSPVQFLELAAGGNVLDYNRIAGLKNGAEPEVRTGDILLSTLGFEVGSTYSLLLEMQKKYI